jgi:hypothetical protein
MNDPKSKPSIRKASFTKLLNGPIPNTGGFLHILFAVFPLILSVIGVIVYFLQVNTSNRTVEAVFLTFLSIITAGFSTFNAYTTYTGESTRSNSFWGSVLACLFMIVYIYYIIGTAIKQKE